MNTKNRIKITTIILFLIAQLSFAQIFNFNYDTGITKEKALANAKLYEEDIQTYGYTFTRPNVKSPENYEIIWSKTNKETGELKVQMAYDFTKTSVKIEMINAVYSTKDTSVYISQNKRSPVIKNVYEANRELFVNVYMKYINLEE